MKTISTTINPPAIRARRQTNKSRTVSCPTGRPRRALSEILKKFLLSLAATSAAWLLTSLPAPAATQEVARTAPVGIATLRVPGKSARALSFPLANPAVFSGKIASVSGSVIQNNGTAWAPDAWGPFATNPHVVRILTGDAAGQIFAIESNSSDAIVLATNADGQVAAGQEFEVVPVDTLAGVFGETGNGLLTGADAGKADNILIHENGGWATYFNDGTRWLKAGGPAAAQNTHALLPDQGMFIVRRAATPLVLSVNGEVPAVQSASELPADALTFLANPFPLNTRLKDLQLQEDPSWQAGPDAASADRVQIHTGKKWTVYFFDGKDWRQEGGALSNPAITKGSAIVVERTGGPDIVHAPTPPYSLN